MPPGSVELRPVRGMPEVATGDDVAALLLAALASTGERLEAGDIVVVSSKVVSKAAGLWAPDRAAAIDAGTVRVVAERLSPSGVTRIVETLAGPVMAAAGVDASNTGDREDVLVLPADPDAAASTLRARLAELAGLDVDALGVVVSDTAGRPWRSGQTDLALGAAGVCVLDDLRGGVDADGRPLAVTARALADELAAAADLVKGKVAAVPAAVVRGLGDLLLTRTASPQGARSLVRTGPGDWFALGHREAVRGALGVLPGTSEARECGIPDVAPQALGVVLGRAVAVALTGEREDVGVDVGPAEVVVTGPDPYAVGRVVARLEVALAGEDLRAEAAGWTPTGVRVRVTASGSQVADGA